MAANVDQVEMGANLAEFAEELSHSLEELAGPGSTLPPLATTDANPYFPPAAAPQTNPRSDVDAVIMDIPVTLKVVLGTAKMPVAAISKMTRGTVIKLDSKVGDPVDIYVNGRFLARGQVVVLDDEQSRFGVTLTQVGGNQTAKR